MTPLTPLRARPSIATDNDAAQLVGEKSAFDRMRALLTFVVLTFGLSWGLAWTSTLVEPAALSEALYVLCGFGPSLAALITVRIWDGRAGLARWLGQCLTWRLRIGWYLLAFLAPPLVMLGALLLHVAMGGAVPSSPAVSDPSLIVSSFALILLIGGPFSEEFGWRGYALPMLAGRFGWRAASLIIGVVWGLWHAPLFFIPGAPQAEMPPLLFLIGTVGMSVAFSRLAVNTGFSVLPAIVLHWSINTFAWAIPVMPQGGTLQPYVLVIGLLSLSAVIVFLKRGPPLPIPSVLS
jgi:membrane protease YdiL (CAAX protease family)